MNERMTAFSYEAHLKYSGRNYTFAAKTLMASALDHTALLGGYGRIHCFLDNDKAGMEAVQELREEYGLRIRDASHIYGGYNDLNDFLRGKQNRQSERRREKPEPEKSQQKAEQPKKKNKGIRM